MRTKPTVTNIQKSIEINPMILIFPRDDDYVRSESPTSNLDLNFYQPQSLNFNGCMKRKNLLKISEPNQL